MCGWWLTPRHNTFVMAFDTNRALVDIVQMNDKNNSKSRIVSDCRCWRPPGRCKTFNACKSLAKINLVHFKMYAGSLYVLVAGCENKSMEIWFCICHCCFTVCLNFECPGVVVLFMCLRKIQMVAKTFMFINLQKGPREKYDGCFPWIGILLCFSTGCYLWFVCFNGNEMMYRMVMTLKSVKMSPDVIAFYLQRIVVNDDLHVDSENMTV